RRSCRRCPRDRRTCGRKSRPIASPAGRRGIREARRGVCRSPRRPAPSSRAPAPRQRPPAAPCALLWQIHVDVPLQPSPRSRSHFTGSNGSACLGDNQLLKQQGGQQGEPTGNPKLRLPTATKRLPLGLSAKFPPKYSTTERRNSAHGYWFP